jgi:hypothetical protein
MTREQTTRFLEQTEELGVRLDPEREDLRSADLFRHLHVPREKHPSEPLTEGEWR